MLNVLCNTLNRVFCFFLVIGKAVLCIVLVQAWPHCIQAFSHEPTTFYFLWLNHKVCGKVNYYLGFLHTYGNVLWGFYYVKRRLQIKRCVIPQTFNVPLKWEVFCRVMFKSCLKSKDFYKSVQTSMSPAPSWVGKLDKFEVLLFIICLRLNEGLLRGSQSPVSTVTEIMTSFHSWLKIIFHLTGVLVFTLNSCCFPICSLTEMVLIMMLDNEHPAGNGVVVLCSLH